MYICACNEYLVYIKSATKPIIKCLHKQKRALYYITVIVRWDGRFDTNGQRSAAERALIGTGNTTNYQTPGRIY